MISWIRSNTHYFIDNGIQFDLFADFRKKTLIFIKLIFSKRKKEIRFNRKPIKSFFIRIRAPPCNKKMILFNDEKEEN